MSLDWRFRLSATLDNDVPFGAHLWYAVGGNKKATKTNSQTGMCVVVSGNKCRSAAHFYTQSRPTPLLVPNRSFFCYTAFVKRKTAPMSRSGTNKQGFTLIELLIVIAIIGFLAAAILVAVDPVKRVKQARNTQRWSEVNSMLEAVLKKQVDERQEYEGETTAPIIEDEDYVQVIVRDDTGIICSQWANRPGCDKDMDLSGVKTCVANLETVAPAYIAELPLDPIGTGLTGCGNGSGCVVEGGVGIGDYNTGYYIHKTANGRIEIGSCYIELAEEVFVKR